MTEQRGAYAHGHLPGMRELMQSMKRNPLTKEQREEIQKVAEETNLKFLMNLIYHPEDTKFIDNAHEWLQQYEDTVQALEAERDMERQWREKLQTDFHSMSVQFDQTKEALTIAVEALSRMNEIRSLAIAKQAIDRINQLSKPKEGR